MSSDARRSGDVPSPGSVRALAAHLREQGRPVEAEALLASVGWRDDAALAFELGLARLEAGRADTAGEAFERALALRPDAVAPAFNLAALRKDEGRTNEAVALLRRVVALAPDLAAARFALVMAHLPPVYADEAEVDRRRRDYAAELDALVAHAAAVGPERLADGIGAAQPFLLPYAGVDDEAELQRRYGALVRRASAHLDPPLAPPPLARGERLRLGIVSGHLRDHSVWRLPTRGWVEGLDRTRFELIGYHTGDLVDAETRRAAALFGRFDQGPLAFADWRDRIAADRPHALLYPEVGMDPMVARLAALRLAPAQYASWGHPVTTGYPTIDFYLSSDAMEGEGAERRYTEALVRLPGLSTPFAVAPSAGEPRDRRSLGVPDDAVIHWCGQSPSKYLPRHDGAFAAIAARAPASRFVFVGGAPALAGRLRARLARAFAARGLAAADHLVFLPELTPADYRAAMAASDLVLDSLGWSGCNTLVEALGLGLPIVTCPGAAMRSRHGAALLAMLGEEGLIGADEGAYVELAAALARDPDRRAQVAGRLRTVLHRLDDRSGVEALERHLLRPYAG